VSEEFFNKAAEIKTCIFKAKTLDELNEADRCLLDFTHNYDYMDALEDGESPQIFAQTTDYLCQLVDSKREKYYKY